ncbi:MAG: hypothetical protein IMF11_06810 [Proteobacteria bacterium]|nr:hypothetical protein [Pseudomonadota bacterium]
MLKERIEKIMQGQALDLLNVGGNYEDAAYLRRTKWRISQILTTIREAAEEGMPRLGVVIGETLQSCVDAQRQADIKWIGEE